MYELEKYFINCNSEFEIINLSVSGDTPSCKMFNNNITMATNYQIILQDN